MQGLHPCQAQMYEFVAAAFNFSHFSALSCPAFHAARKTYAFVPLTKLKSPLSCRTAPHKFGLWSFRQFWCMHVVINRDLHGCDNNATKINLCVGDAGCTCRDKQWICACLCNSTRLSSIENKAINFY